MNIIQVVNSRWWNAETAYAFELSKGLRDAGHKVCLIALPGKYLAVKASQNNICCYETDFLNTSNPFSVIMGIKKLAHIIDDEKIDVVNCHRSEGFPLILLASWLSKSKPAIVRTRGDQRQVRKGLLNKLMYGRYADMIIASGEVIKNNIVSRLAIEDDNIRVVYASVDIDKFKPCENFVDIREELCFSKEDALVAILGRVSEVKGHKYFIEAVEIVSKTIPNSRFLIIVKEDAPDLALLKKMVADCGMEEKIAFIGFREDLVDVMLSCDIGVVSSIGSETNCRVVLEWMSVGKPVVGTAVGVIPEVLRDGRTGYLVPPGDGSAIAEALVKLINDRALREKFGRAARRLVEDEYSLKTMADNTISVYRKAIS